MNNGEAKKERNFWRVILAWGLIVLGIAGIILPVLPGWPFFFLGLFILAGDDKAREKIISLFPQKTRPRVKKYFDTVYENRRKKAKLRNRERTQAKRP